MRRMNLAAAAATFSMAALVGFAESARAQITAYEGARLIVGNGSAPIENATIVVDGARIAQAGAAAAVKVPAGAKRVSLAGKTVMPAVINTHVHLSPKRESILRDLKRHAYFGAGAVMSAGFDSYDVLDIRGQTIPGSARFFSAGRGITMPEPGRLALPHWIANEGEGRKTVQELAANKVDVVKIWVDDRGAKYKKLTPDIYGPIIDEAHKRGLRVVAHHRTLEDAKGLIRAGIDALAHGIRDADVDDELVALVKQRPNLILTPLLPDRGVTVDLSWMREGLPAAEFEKLEKGNTDRPQSQASYRREAGNLAKLNAAGMRITLGTDGNRPWAPHDEMEDMVRAGMTPMQVILASTRDAAAFLQIADAGTVEAGKSADLLVLDANPLDDITNTRRIAAVILRGATVDRSKPVE